MPHDLLKDWIEIFSLVSPAFLASLQEWWKTGELNLQGPHSPQEETWQLRGPASFHEQHLHGLLSWLWQRQLRYSDVGTHVCSVCFYGGGAFDWSCCSGHLRSLFPLKWSARAGCCLCCSSSRRPRLSCIELPWTGRHPDGRHLLKDAWYIHLVFNVDIFWWKCLTIQVFHTHSDNL